MAFVFPPSRFRISAWAVRSSRFLCAWAVLSMFFLGAYGLVHLSRTPIEETIRCATGLNTRAFPSWPLFCEYHTTWLRLTSSDVEDLNALPSSLLQDIMDGPASPRLKRYWLTTLVTKGVQLDTKYEGLTLVHRAILDNQPDHLAWLLDLSPDLRIKSSPATGYHTAEELAVALQKKDMALMIQNQQAEQKRIDDALISAVVPF